MTAANVKKTRVSKSSAAKIAGAYGFSQIENIYITQKDKDSANTIAREYDSLPNRDGEEKISLLRFYDEERMDKLSWPTAVFREEYSSRGGLIFHMDIIGCGKSIAEAIVIKTACEILKEYGEQQFCLRVNSHGDRESFNRFVRELRNFYSKKKTWLHQSCLNESREDFFAPIYCAHKECSEACEEVPTPVCFLSEPARLHFKEVIEHIESMRIPYLLSERFFGPAGIASHTVFDIKDNKGTLLAKGFRYNHLSRRIGFRREIPALGATISLKNIQKTKDNTSSQPKIYLIQLGNEAKRISLNLLEEFRKMDIFVAHNLAYDKLSEQIERAESLQIPYLVIVGQKEALDGTVLIRDREKSFQETLPAATVPMYLKKLLA